jgi:arsenate reductase
MTDWLVPETRRGLETVTAQLIAEFSGIHPPETVIACMGDTLKRWSPTGKQHFLPVVIYRFVRDRLRALGQNEGRIVKGRPLVLFVSVSDAARAQMAAGLLSSMAADSIDVCSAGTAVAAEVDPDVVAVLAEVGVDLRAAFPKPLTTEILRAADVVVTIGGAGVHPDLARIAALDWGLPELGSRTLEELRAARDDLDRLVSELLTSLGPRE